MENYDFEFIKERVLEWGEKYIKNKDGFIEMVKNERDILIYDLTFLNCLAQIVVRDVSFAPYKCVSFEAMTMDSRKSMESGQPELIYFFYDSEDTLPDQVIEELDKGIEYCIHYIPDQLEATYIGKKGSINCATKKKERYIHPDDLTKADQILYQKDVICISVQYQYLVVRNDVGFIRVLPEVFRESDRM